MDRRVVYIVLGIISIILFWDSKETGIFWDNVIFAGKMGNHLYEKGMLSWNFPNSFDPGHPPFLALILVSGWHVLGKSLFVSHLMLLPFVFGLLVQLYRLCEHYLYEPKYLILGFTLVIAEPTLTTHLMIINPELLILFFFFLATNALLKGNHKLKVLALCFLGVTSLRGMLLCGGFFLFECGILFLDKDLMKKSTLKRLVINYAIGAIPALLYIAGRLYFKGWVSSHPEFPWLEFRQPANLHQFLRNIVVLTHRYLDFGKVFIFLFLFLAFIIVKPFKERKIKEILLFAIIPTLPLIITSLREVNPMGHRYFMISYTGFILLAIYILSQQTWKYRSLIYGVLLIGLITGNFWIYPRDIAQGWDASLAHLPYYPLRKKAINYIDKNNISIHDVTTFSPNATIIDNVDLNNDKRSLAPFNENSKYVLYSNVYNLTDQELMLLDKHYKPLKTFEKNRIYVHLFRRK